jgi:hypothetical protein
LETRARMFAHACAAAQQAAPNKLGVVVRKPDAEGRLKLQIASGDLLVDVCSKQ